MIVIVCGGGGGGVGNWYKVNTFQEITLWLRKMSNKIMKRLRGHAEMLQVEEVKL